MPYKKFLIVASKLDKAGINITTNLSQFQGSSADFHFYLVDEEVIYTENLDMEKINSYDFIIFASKHKSESKEKTLSVHAPGNWRLAEFGGEKNKACKSSALFMKHIFEKLNENVAQYQLDDYKVTLEATHHGPLIEKPCLFIEIGSTETEWTNSRPGFIVAKTINEAINDFKENQYVETAIAIGGPHYCPSFNKIQLKSNVAISHVIPQYVFPLTEEMVLEAVQKTDEELDFALLDWKGLGNAEQRQRVISILNKLYINYKKTSDIGK
ncbi:MAG: D-aminoacyl-tRNA deacylase [Nanoarchaeota archaeon]|nr:D-aminoacyl-tRNA deacylase [Nanoarchaeota archaeon]